MYLSVNTSKTPPQMTNLLLPLSNVLVVGVFAGNEVAAIESIELHAAA
jgi:hypothetical protein